MEDDATPCQIDMEYPAGASSEQKDALFTLSSTGAAAVAIAATQRWVTGAPDDLTELAAELKRQSESEGNGVEILQVQAKTLDLMFYQLVGRAMQQDDVNVADVLLKLAFKAQAQSRATLAAISDIRHPRITNNIGQVNNANGPQQVNNSHSTRTEKKIDSQSECEHTPNELSEGLPDDLLQNTGTTTNSTRADLQGAALEAGDWSKNTEG